MFNNNGVHRMWESVKTNSVCRVMMHGSNDIVLMVVVS